MTLGKKCFLSAIAAGVVLYCTFLYRNVPQFPVYEQSSVAITQPKTFASAAEATNVSEATNAAETNAAEAVNVVDTPEQIAPEPTILPAADAGATDDIQPPKANEPTISPIVLNTAAAENSRLRYNIGWVFGGKSQYGWFLYVPLIQQTIGAQQDADTPDFARAVIGWQQKSGLAPNGIVDDKTLYKIVEYWQSRRLNNSDYPSPDQLLTAPTADFCDPMREPDLRRVERETYAAYKRMIAAAAKDRTLNLKATPSGELAPDEKYLKIVSSFRSREYQAKLRRESPGSGRAGLAVNSPHFTGRALDVYVGGEPTITKDSNRALQVQTPAYKWLVQNAERFGFYPYYYEPWHWEFIPERLRKTASPAK